MEAAKPKYEKVTFEQAKQMMDTMPELLVLDVREEEEYITGHAIGALLFTLGDIDEEMAAATIPSKTTPVMVYCRSGKRSRAAAAALLKLGYMEIYDIGGLVGWPYGLE